MDVHTASQENQFLFLRNYIEKLAKYLNRITLQVTTMQDVETVIRTSKNDLDIVFVNYGQDSNAITEILSRHLYFLPFIFMDSILPPATFCWKSFRRHVYPWYILKFKWKS